jgi:hypothetical protein
LTYAGLGQMLASGKMFARKINGMVAITDFVNVYNAGLLSQRSLSGERINVYDPAVQSASQEKLIAPEKPDWPFFLQYPPWFFALMLPLSLASTISIAYCAWSAVWLVGLLFCLNFVLKHTSFERRDKFLAVACVLASYPTWLSFGMGQTSFMNFTAMVGGLILLRKRKMLAAGLVSSLVAVKLQYAPVMFIIGLMVGRLRFVGGFALGMVALALYSLAILGLDNLLAWPHALLMGETSSHVSGVSPITMQCLRGYLTLLMHGTDAKVVAAISAIFFVAGLLAVAAIWWHFSRRRSAQGEPVESGSEDDFRFSSALTFLLMAITSMHTHVYDYLMMLLPAIWLFDLSRRDQSVEAKILQALVLIYPVASWLSARYIEQLGALYFRFDLFWAVALLALGFRSWKRLGLRS